MDFADCFGNIDPTYADLDTKAMTKDFENMTFDSILEGIGINVENVVDNTCPSCGETEFVEDAMRGMVVCKCGQVIDDIIEDGAEKRYYDDDSGTARCAVPHNKLLPQSSLGTSVNVSGKLRKLQTWCSMPYKERSNNVLYKRIQAVCTEFKIPGMVEYDAKLICMRVSSKVHTTGENIGKPIITRGRNRSGIVAGCLYIACRKNGTYTRSAREIADYFNVEESDVNKGVSSIQSILKNDPIIQDIGTSNVTDFIKRKCDELRIRNVDAKRAMTIGNNLERLGIASNHTTYALAAAAILLMSDINGLTHITKRVLSESFSKLTDVTIGKTYNQIQHLREILMSDMVTAEIIRRVNQKRKRRVLPQAVAEKMRDFGVDTSKYVIEGEEDQYTPPITSESSEEPDSFTESDTQRDSGEDEDRAEDQNEDDFNEITMEDICELIEEIRSAMLQVNSIEGENDPELVESLLQQRMMIVQFVKEYPETLDQKNVDVEFFLNEFCPTPEDRDEIIAMRENDDEYDMSDKSDNSDNSNQKARSKRAVKSKATKNPNGKTKKSKSSNSSNQSSESSKNVNSKKKTTGAKRKAVARRR